MTDNRQLIMTRAEHLQWAKDRAKEYVDMGDAAQALASFTSDMGKHPDLAQHPAMNPPMSSLGLQAAMQGPQAVGNWIEGFN